MPQPNKIPLAFAASGDKNTIPENTETTGLASWREGFPAITSAPFSEGGVAPKRTDFNGVFNALSAATIWAQQGGVYAYDATTDYEIGNLAVESRTLYICKTANGPGSAVHAPASDSAETYWGRIYPQNGTFDRVFFSQTSGNYTAPYTGVYRITLKGGGGGGAGGHTGPRGGSGGGEGGTLVLYRTLIKDTAYPYTIGAGGAGGAQNNSGSAGSDGGSTSITINGTTVSANYGGGAGSPSGTSNGGTGGDFSVVSDSFGIYGAPGQTGPFLVGSGLSSFSVGGSGGGAGGGQGVVDSSGAYGRYGGGGAGGGVYNATSYAGGDGGNGYILIEYAG